MVVNTEVVEKLTVFRAEGRIEVSIVVDRDEINGVKGMLVCIFFVPSLHVTGLLTIHVYVSVRSSM